MVAGAFLVNMVGFGAAYSYAAFAPELEAAFGASRASVSLVFALSGGTAFAVSALSGPLSDRTGPRVPAAVGMLLVGVGMTLAATARTLAEVYVCYGLLIGLGVGFAYVPATAAVQRCFDARRGLASGIAATGVGVGTALVPPAAEFLARLGDWRVAFVVSGALAAALGLTGALLLHDGPKPGAPRSEKARGRAPPALDEGTMPGGPLRSRAFVLLYLGTLLVSVPIALPFVHLVASARDMGLPPADALGLLGQLGLGSIAGRFLLGALADMLGRRRVFLLCCAGVAAATLLWAASPGRAGLTVFALAFGMLYGGFVALLPAFTVDCFGPRAVGRALGLLYTGRAAALFAAPVAAAALFAAGHTLPLAGAAVLGAAGTLVLGRVTPASRAWSAARGGPGALKVGTEPLPPPMALPPSPSPVRTR